MGMGLDAPHLDKYTSIDCPGAAQRRRRLLGGRASGCPASCHLQRPGAAAVAAQRSHYRMFWERSTIQRPLENSIAPSFERSDLNLAVWIGIALFPFDLAVRLPPRHLSVCMSMPMNNAVADYRCFRRAGCGRSVFWSLLWVRTWMKHTCLSRAKHFSW